MKLDLIVYIWISNIKYGNIAQWKPTSSAYEIKLFTLLKLSDINSTMTHSYICVFTMIPNSFGKLETDSQWWPASIKLSLNWRHHIKQTDNKEELTTTLDGGNQVIFLQQWLPPLWVYHPCEISLLLLIRIIIYYPGTKFSCMSSSSRHVSSFKYLPSCSMLYHVKEV